ncbi:putative AbiEii toxin of type IV toxin-antitoxin system [Tepidamorphus gemmatus]|uniref:Putative AbiEii toxin of type IV toxin-antitoxin system n=1 Tax=Tepidamorphus gemmatus TaxID=747076 RepID=A0A4V2UZR2_9HYPH|nr:ATP-binding protein [Tepidamorphus gemmatus]TCT12333.1 putative AbiEii toxin of type IV toxin-antitoxin system [Tepidamorphus gemmatus]
MRLRAVKINNFKAIDEATIDLADFTVIVGANGSGKSSVLQALHWMFQSGRSRKIEPRADVTKARVLSEKDASYMPTPQYRAAGYAADYGNKQGAPQFTLEVEAKDAQGKAHEANMWIRSAHNEGISVHIPSGNAITSLIRDKREISAYIPGLAGIPLQEERRGKFIVARQAAAGDANTVLRNILLRLKENDQEGFERLQALVSEVMGPLALQVSFEEAESGTITAEFQTEPMRQADQRRFKPLELAGIGFLQVIQIFAYLVYFRPVLLLVDEPDSHLHPATQERLIRVLARAAAAFDTQVIVTTHSPSVIRALPAEARVVWMRDGKVQPNGDTAGRQMMGWGLLDKRILLLTEDKKTNLLRAILAQWPDLERTIAIWPLHGSGRLLDPAGCASLQALMGDSMKIVLHRDRDFMMPNEAEAFCKPYADKHVTVWLTRQADIEGYWCEVPVIAGHFGIDAQTARSWLDSAVERAKQGKADAGCRNSKRHAIRNQPPLRSLAEKGQLNAASDKDVVTEYGKNGAQHVILGKTLVSQVRAVAQSNGNKAASSFGDSLPAELGVPVAEDLKALLEDLLQ